MSYTNGYLDKVERQCTGKRGYSNKRYAKEAGRRAEQHTKVRLTAYRCPHCDLFHLGQRR
jgi:hypothetical protein